jgi:uncharacterized surface anchored protein
MKLLQKMVSVLLAFLLAWQSGTAVQLPVHADALEVDSIKIENYAMVYIRTENENRRNGRPFYIITIKDTGELAYCLNPYLDPPDSSRTYSQAELAGTDIARIAYYGYGYGNHQSDLWRVATQTAIWDELGLIDSWYMARGEDDKFEKEEDTKAVKGCIAEIRRLIEDCAPLNRTDVDPQRMAFVHNTSAASLQNIMNVGFWPESLKIEVEKKAYEEVLSAADTAPPAGAQFDIYTDEACQNLLYSMAAENISTDETGHAELVMQASAGIKELWAVETKAPEGYELDQTPIRFETSRTDGGFTASFTKEDHLRYCTMPLVITKKSTAVSDQPSSLTGAEFTVRYYSDDLDGEAARTWVIQTQADGSEAEAVLDEEHLVSGDDLFMTADGTPVLPPGTLTIQETKAPEGYTMNGKFIVAESGKEIGSASADHMAVLHIAELDGEMRLVFENAPAEVMIREEKPIMGTLQVQKSDKASGRAEPQGDAADLQTELRIVNQNGCTKYIHDRPVADGESYTFTTDQTGSAVLDQIEYGRYLVEEVRPPHGYTLDGGNTSAEIRIDQEGASVQLTGGEISDYPMYYRLVFAKRDSITDTYSQGDTDLHGIYSIINSSSRSVIVNGREAGPGEEVMRFETDAAGNYTSEKIFPYGTYTIREISAPQGYSSKGYALNEAEAESVETVLAAHDETDDTISTVFHNNVITGNFSLAKVTEADENGAADPEEGVEFTAVLASKIGPGRTFATFAEAYSAVKAAVPGSNILSEDGTILLSACEYSLLKTDHNGRAESGMLAYGTYEIRQTSSYPGTKDLTDPILFTVSEENQATKHYTAVNERLDFLVRLMKKDASTGKTVSLQGTSFQVYRIQGSERHLVTQKVGMFTCDTFTTNNEGHLTALGSGLKGEYISSRDEKGTVVMPLKLKTGRYEITEVKTPSGYMPLHEPLAFTVSSQDFSEVDEEGRNVITIEISDERVLGSLKVVKSIAEAEADYSLIRRDDLSGFGFELRAAENIIDPADGTVIARKGDPAKILTENTYVETSVLYTDQKGNISLNKIPLGRYILKETVQPDGIASSEKTYPITFSADEKKPAGVIVHQESIENRATRTSISKKAVAGDDELEGAVLTLMNSSGHVIETWTSGNQPHVIEGLKAGEKYRLREDLAPLGYVKASEIQFEVPDQGAVHQVVMKDQVMRINKTDGCGRTLEGAVFAVFAADEKGSPAGEALERWTAGEKPHMVSHLEAGGKYVLVEEEAPDGYVKMKNRKFTVKDNGRDQTVQVENVQIRITKKDIGGEEVEGALLTVTDRQTGEVVDQWTSGTRPHEIRCLEEGRAYTLREDTAPLGFVKVSSIDFTVGKKNETIELIDTIERIAKTDENGKLISGAVMEAADSDGNVIETWTSGRHVLDLSEEQKKALKQGTSIHFTREDGSAVTVRPFVKTDESETEKKELSEENSKTDAEFCEIPSTDETAETEKTELPEGKKYGYTAVMKMSDGTVSYVDIDLNGNETEHRISGLTAGRVYTVREKETPVGFYSADEKAVKPSDEADHLTEMVDAGIHYQIAKVDDETGEYVAGVTLQLSDITNPENPVAVELPNGGITGDRPFELERTLIGGHTYELAEIESAAGYHKAAALQFTVPEKGTPEIMKIVMRDVPTGVRVQKVDNHGNPVKGAEMCLMDQEGNVLYAFTSSDEPEGTDISAYVKGGETYILHESEAPFGLQKAADVSFTVTGTAQTHQVILVEDVLQSYYIAVEKTDENDMSMRLAGAEFTLYTEDGQIAVDINGKQCIGTTDDTGRVIFQVEYAGTLSGYYVMETEAPEGYSLNKDKHEAVLSEDYDFALKNPILIRVSDRRKPRLPFTSALTGVISGNARWFCLFAGALCGLLLAVVKKSHLRL